MKLKRKEILLFSILLIAALAAWGIFRYRQSKKRYGSIRITTYEGVLGTFSLGEDQEIVIDTALGHNVCVIKDGQAFMSEADCPDQRCVEGFPPLTGQDDVLGWIVCLPHQVIIESIPADDTQANEDIAVDGITG